MQTTGLETEIMQYSIQKKIAGSKPPNENFRGTPQNGEKCHFSDELSGFTAFCSPILETPNKKPRLRAGQSISQDLNRPCLRIRMDIKKWVTWNSRRKWRRATPKNEQPKTTRKNDSKLLQMPVGGLSGCFCLYNSPRLTPKGGK